MINQLLNGTPLTFLCTRFRTSTQVTDILMQDDFRHGIRSSVQLAALSSIWSLPRAPERNIFAPCFDITVRSFRGHLRHALDHRLSRYQDHRSHRQSDDHDDGAEDGTDRQPSISSVVREQCAVRRSTISRRIEALHHSRESSRKIPQPRRSTSFAGEVPHRSPQQEHSC